MGICLCVVDGYINEYIYVLYMGTYMCYTWVHICVIHGYTYKTVAYGYIPHINKLQIIYIYIICTSDEKEKIIPPT